MQRGWLDFSSQGTIYGHYGGLFRAIVMDSAQLLSIMEKDGRTTMHEVIGPFEKKKKKTSSESGVSIMNQNTF